MRPLVAFALIITLIVSFACDCFSAQFPEDARMKKIFLQGKIISEGDLLAHQGRYEEAIAKFNRAMDPDCINNERDKAAPQLRIIIAHKRQGKFQIALQEHTEWRYAKYSKHDAIANEQAELLALVKAQEIKDKKPIEDHIRYLRHKYEKQLPPNKYYAGFSDPIIDDLIHLYDYTQDYDSGIAFMNELINYFTKSDYAESLGNKKAIKEYTRIKKAWELDKQTGQHGHLQEVIRTSDIISW